MSARFRWLPFALPISGLFLLVRCGVAVLDPYGGGDAPRTVLGTALCKFDRVLFDWRGPELERRIRESVRVHAGPREVVLDLESIPSIWKTVCVAEFDSAIRNVPPGQVQWPACQGYSWGHATLYFASDSGRVLALRTDNLDELAKHATQPAKSRPNYGTVGEGCRDRVGTAVVCRVSRESEWICGLAKKD